MEYRIELRRSRRARRTSLRITPEGEVRLTIPWWMPKGPALRWAESRKEWIEGALQRHQQRRNNAHPPRTPQEIEALRELAHRVLPERLRAASEKTGIGYGRLTIRASRTRWGSCSSSGNISLSLFLAELPEELIDFVCIHELCHRIHPNHSKEFHALVDYHTGGHEKELQKMLKKYTP